ARHGRSGKRFGAISGDTEADVLVGVRLIGIDLPDKPFGCGDLLKSLIVRREPNLLIAKLLQNWAMILSLHGTPHSLLLAFLCCCGVPCESIAHCRNGTFQGASLPPIWQSNHSDEALASKVAIL